MKTAIVIDLLVQRGGAEYMLEVISKAYPDADIYTLLYDPSRTFSGFRNKKIIQPRLARRPVLGAVYRSMHKLFLPVYPLMTENFDFKGYDLVISLSFLAVKNIVTPASCLHICYCLTPARYIWELPHQYLAAVRPAFLRALLFPVMHRLRLWDELRSNGVDRFIAISECVRRRIEKRYRRESVVLQPPYDHTTFRPDRREAKGDYYMVSSRLVPYKNTALAVTAFNRNGRKLVITGSGPESERLKKLAGPNISFTGYVEKEELAILYRRARALIFPGEEDFGISMVNSMACGTPVIAYKRGAAQELIKDGITGVLFEDNTEPAALCAAVLRFEEMALDPVLISGSVRQFGEDRFVGAFRECVEKAVLYFKA